MTDGNGSPGGATPELKRLGVFEGRWKTTGRVLATPTQSELPIVGTDEYEWLPGGYFMLHRVDVVIGESSVRTLEVIGYDSQTGRYPTRFFDHQGNTGTFEADTSDDTWTFDAEGARATLTVHPGGSTMEAVWERKGEGGSWERWMVLEFTRL